MHQLHQRFVVFAFALCLPLIALASVSGDFVNSTGEVGPTDDLFFRLSGLSKDAPIANLLADIPGLGALHNAFAEYFEDVVSEFNCVIRDQQWQESLPTFVALRKWPKPSTACVSSTRDPIKRDRDLVVSARELMEMTKRFYDVLDLRASKVGEAVGIDWPNVFVQRGWTHESGFQVCLTEKMLGVRFREVGNNQTRTGRWYFHAGFTNFNIREDVPDRVRQYVTEYTTANANGNISFPFTINARPYRPENPNLVNISDPFEQFTTSFQQWAGHPGLSSLFNMEPLDSPSLIQALQKGEPKVEQANDAIWGSNIAILALPMVMNLVPISLITDVSTLGLLVYTLMSDILSALPFLIKGFELAAMGHSVDRATETWYSDSSTEVNDSPWIIAEMWVSECRMIHVGRTGYAFIAIAFTFIVVGLTAEWYARILRLRWRRDAAAGVDILTADMTRDQLLQHELRRVQSPSRKDAMRQELAAFEEQQRRMAARHALFVSRTDSDASDSQTG